MTDIIDPAWMDRSVPILHDAELKSIPRALLEPHLARCMINTGRTIDQLEGLTPEEALAIIEDRPWQRMAASEAREQLRQYMAPHVRVLRPPTDEERKQAVDDALLMARSWLAGNYVPARHHINKLVTMLERAAR